MSSRPEWPATMLDALIRVEQSDQPCWRMGKYLGSMLTFDFGGHVPIQTGSGSMVQLGTSTIGVRDVWWRASGAGLEALDSDEAEDFPGAWMRLRDCVIGANIAGLAREPDALTLRFSNGLRLQLDTTNIYEEEADTAAWVLQLSGGAWFDVMPDGRILLNAQFSKGGREEAA